MGDTHSRPSSAWSENCSVAPLTRETTSTSERGSLPQMLSSSSIASLRVMTSSPKTLCEEAPPPVPPLPAAQGSVEPPPPPASPDSIEQAAKSVSSYTNPGPYDHLGQDAKSLVMVETYDGFRCNINKQVSPFMAVIHSFHLGTSMDMAGRKNLYTFLTQVADENGMLMARVDPSRLSVDGRIHKALGPVLGRMQVSVSPEGQTDQMMAEFDINGATWSGNLKYGTGGGGNVYGVNYLQSVTPKLAIGGEGMYVAANQNTINSYSIKYDWMAPVSNADAIDATPKPTGRGPNGPDPAGASYLCASYNSAQGALSLNYKRTVTPGRLVLGAELTCSPFTLDSQVTVGAEFKWQRSKLNLAVDGGGRIQSVLEAKYGMSPGAPTLQFSADVDHFKEEMKFGYGISIDS